MLVIAVAVPCPGPEGALARLAPSPLIPSDFPVEGAVSVDALGESLDPHDHLRAHGGVGGAAVKVHRSVIERVTAPLVVGGVAPVAVKRFSGVEADSVHDDGSDDNDQHREEQRTRLRLHVAPQESKDVATCGQGADATRHFVLLHLRCEMVIIYCLSSIV